MKPKKYFTGLDPEDWMDLAKCKGQPSQLFFADENLPPYVNQRLQAEGKKICSECPVKEECLDYAWRMELGIYPRTFGIYAGLGPSERCELFREWRKYGRPDVR